MAACPHCQHQPRSARMRAWWGRHWGVVATVGLTALGAFAFAIYVEANTYACGRTPTSQRLRLKSIESALRQYSIDNGYPTQQQGLAVLVDPPGGEKPYLEATPRDVWNNPIIYIAPDTLGAHGASQDAPFVVFSAGKDGVVGTADDLFLRRKRRRS